MVAGDIATCPINSPNIHFYFLLINPSLNSAFHESLEEDMIIQYVQIGKNNSIQLL